MSPEAQSGRKRAAAAPAGVPAAAPGGAPGSGAAEKIPRVGAVARAAATAATAGERKSSDSGIPAASTVSAALEASPTPKSRFAHSPAAAPSPGAEASDGQLSRRNLRPRHQRTLSNRGRAAMLIESEDDEKEAGAPAARGVGGPAAGGASDAEASTAPASTGASRRRRRRRVAAVSPAVPSNFGDSLARGLPAETRRVRKRRRTGDGELELGQSRRRAARALSHSSSASSLSEGGGAGDPGGGGEAGEAGGAIGVSSFKSGVRSRVAGRGALGASVSAGSDSPTAGNDPASPTRRPSRGGGGGEFPETVSGAGEKSLLELLVEESDQFTSALLARDQRGGRRGGADGGGSAAGGRGARTRASSAEETAALLDADSAGVTRLAVQPSSISGGVLKPYQLEGLNWLINLYEQGLNGILADEMGLGKTLQSIALLAWLKESRGVRGPHLILAPKSTLGNWEKEIARFCPGLRAFKYQGSKEERSEMRTADQLSPETHDIFITSYELCMRDTAAFRKISFKYIIVDEAHRIKNEASKLAIVLRSFSSEFRLLLTGTPLQNNLRELWSLLNFLYPQIFASGDEFERLFDLTGAHDEGRALSPEEKNARNLRIVARLHKILRPFLLRRVKSEVMLELPPKKELLLYVPLTKLQRELYRSLLARNVDAAGAGAVGDAGAGAGAGGTTSNHTSVSGRTSLGFGVSASAVPSSAAGKLRLLNVAMQLRKACNHPYLFEGLEDRSQNPYGEHLVAVSGKLQLLDRLLSRLFAEGRRVLIFSQMTSMLDILEDYCRLRGFDFCRIDGTTEDRESQLEAFNAPGSPKSIFLLSTRAGGLGVNLATADTVVLYDSDWNPQVDLQAMDRAHRIGQRRPVTVFRLLHEHTIEEKILERAMLKLRLDTVVIQQGRGGRADGGGGRPLGRGELLRMIQFGADRIFKEGAGGEAGGAENGASPPAAVAITGDTGAGGTGADGAAASGATATDGRPLPAAAPGAAAAGGAGGAGATASSAGSSQAAAPATGVGGDGAAPAVSTAPASDGAAPAARGGPPATGGAAPAIGEAAAATGAGLTDADLDSILRRGESRTAELNGRLETRVDQLQVLLNFDPAASGSASLYEFEGVDYQDQQVRDRRAWAAMAVRSLDDRRQARRKVRLMHEQQEEEQREAAAAARAQAERERRERAVAAEADSRRAAEHRRAVARSLRLPRMEDWHFFENRPRISELHARAVRHSQGAGPPLSPAEAEEKQQLLASGFPGWSRRDFFAFVRACEAHGASDAAAVAKYVGKPAAEVARYAAVFSRRYAEVADGEKLFRRVQSGDTVAARHDALAAALARKLASVPRPWLDLRTSFPKAKTYFSDAEDRWLLNAAAVFGFARWHAVHAVLMRDTRLHLDWFLRTRTPADLARRAEFLVRQIQKELVDGAPPPVTRAQSAGGGGDVSPAAAAAPPAPVAAGAASRPRCSAFYGDEAEIYGSLIAGAEVSGASPSVAAAAATAAAAVNPGAAAPPPADATSSATGAPSQPSGLMSQLPAPAAVASAVGPT